MQVDSNSHQHLLKKKKKKKKTIKKLKIKYLRFPPEQPVLITQLLGEAPSKYFVEMHDLHFYASLPMVQFPT